MSGDGCRTSLQADVKKVDVIVDKCHSVPLISNAVIILCISHFHSGISSKKRNIFMESVVVTSLLNATEVFQRLPCAAVAPSWTSESIVFEMLPTQQT